MPGNYRPIIIGLTSVVVKLLESLFRDLMNHFMTKHLFADEHIPLTSRHQCSMAL